MLRPDASKAFFRASEDDLHRLSYKLLLLLSLVAAAGGVITMIPAAGASYPNIIGYSSLCTFAPAAALYCFFIAGSSCFIRATFIKDQSGSLKDRAVKHRKSLIPLVIVLITAIGFTFWFASVKAEYTDSFTAATETEE